MFTSEGAVLFCGELRVLFSSVLYANMSEKQIKKRERGANYTPDEKAMLTDLITQYKYVIEDKRTGGYIINKKKEAWKSITTKYNSNCTTGPRQMDQLKALYDNMKQKSRKNVGENNKLEYMNTLMQNAEDNVFVTKDDLATALKHVKQGGDTENWWWFLETYGDQVTYVKKLL